MGTFRYTAIATGGRRTTGTVSGASEQAALAELERRKLTPLRLEAARDAGASGQRLPAGRLAAVYQQLADLLRAGVPLLRGLRLVAGGRVDARVAAAFATLADQVADGEELADAMAGCGRAFPDTHVAIVRAGEHGGFLDTALQRLAGLVQRQVDLKQKLLVSIMYPATIATLGGIILLGVFFVFIPWVQSQGLYEGSNLPTLTKLLFTVSDLRRLWPWLLGALVLGVFGIRAALRSPEATRRLAVVATRTPLLGRLLRGLAAARFCRILGTLLESGVPILASLRIARDTAGLPQMASAIDAAIEAVKHGARLAEPLSESGVFDDDVVEMIGVGESAGNVDEVLGRIAASLERRVDQTLSVVMTAIEPLLIVLIAGCVVVVALGLILPQMQLVSEIGV